MSDYFHVSDLQAALAALINVQESFHEMYRICSGSITEQRRICNCLYQILDAPIRLRRPRLLWTRHLLTGMHTQLNSTHFWVPPENANQYAE